MVGGLVDGGDAVRADDSKVGGKEAEAVGASGGGDDGVGWVAEDGEQCRCFDGDFRSNWKYFDHGLVLQIVEKFTETSLHAESTSLAKQRHFYQRDVTDPDGLEVICGGLDRPCLFLREFCGVHAPAEVYMRIEK